MLKYKLMLFTQENVAGLNSEGTATQHFQPLSGKHTQILSKTYLSQHDLLVDIC
jgi:hypothetical protein